MTEIRSQPQQIASIQGMFTPYKVSVINKTFYMSFKEKTENFMSTAINYLFFLVLVGWTAEIGVKVYKHFKAPDEVKTEVTKKG